MTKIKFHIVDVFTDRPFAGNQLAVITDARGLSSQAMQVIAREFNFSETTFVLPPEDMENTYQRRIFTPGAEMLMAGHPTVGTAFVLARERMIDTSGDETIIRFEEGVGVIPVTLKFRGGSPELIQMSQPLPTFGPLFPDPAAIAGILSLALEDLDSNLPIEIVSCGVPFLYVPIRTLDAVRRIRIRPDTWSRVFSGFETSNVFAFTQEVERSGSTVHSRMFAPDLGVTEDPATGGASGPLGSYLVRHGLVTGHGTIKIVSEQGIEMGRPSIIQIEIDRKGEEITGVRVGGQVCPIAEGYLDVTALENQ